MSQPLLVIVDDEEDLLDLLAYYFKQNGYEVAMFDRAAQALAFIQKQRPDAVLCDWMMPEMTGLELCQRLKGTLPLADLPFLMFTCRHELSAKRQALAAGATDFITKPMAMPALLQRVDQALKKGQVSVLEEVDWNPKTGGSGGYSYP